MPTTAIQLQGFKELLMLFLRPFFSLFCDCVRLPNLYKWAKQRKVETKILINYIVVLPKKKRQLNGELSVEWNLRCTVVYLLHLVLWLAFCIALGITVTTYNRGFQSHAFTLIHVQTKRRKRKGKLDGSFLSYYNRNQTKKVWLASTWFDNWRRNDNWDKTDINQFWTKREI